MNRGKQRKLTKKVKLHIEENSEQTKLAVELAEPTEELREQRGEPAKLSEPAKLAGEMSQKNQNEEDIQQITQSMADLETILQELRV